MHDGDTTAPPTPLIPAQRRPDDPLSHHPDASPPRSRRTRPVLLGGVLILVAVLAITTIGVLVRRPHSPPPGTPAEAAVPSAVPTPVELMQALLKAQTAALLRGDERGWLAVVDPGQPKLRAQYRTLYRSLRALGVSQFEYHPGLPPVIVKGVATVNVDIAFCFSMAVCPAYPSSAPVIRQTLKFAPIHGRYRISRLQKSTDPSHLQPTPWESGELVFAQGKRVTVAGPPSEAKHLWQVVQIADQAAVTVDRFAVYVGNPQQRYRVYLADDKVWRTWYGGENDKFAIGVEVALNQGGADVVLKMSKLGDRKELAGTIQHELGHVATAAGSHESGAFVYQKNEWLTEGIAEYIEWSPRGATASWRRDSVRLVVRGRHPPKSIVAEPLGAKAGARSVDAFYGLGHFAADCMAHLYGQRKLFDFVRRRLRDGEDLDLAARQAYGKPFATVDKTCVAWIRQRA